MKKIYILFAVLIFAGYTYGQQRSISGVINLEKPNFSVKTPTDTLEPGQFLSGSPVLYSATGGGYVVGNNSYGDIAKGQQFLVTTGYKIEGALYWFGAKEAVSGSGNVAFKVWDMDGTTGTTTAGTGQTCPGTVLGTVSASIGNIDTAAYTVATFATPITISGDYVIGFDVSGISTDTVGLVSTTDGEGGSGELTWEQWSDDTWYTLLQAWPLDFDLAIFPIVDMTVGCVDGNNFIFGMKLSQNYPNPTSNQCLIEYELKNNASDVSLDIIDANGRTVLTKEQGNKTAGIYSINLDVTNLANGTYYYSLNANDQKLIKRMTIVK